MTAEQNLSNKSILSYVAIMRSLFENYESLYDIDVETSAYQCYHESDSYSELNVESSGSDFFADAFEKAAEVVYRPDLEYVRRMLQRKTMLARLEQERYYSFVYRLKIEGRAIYHKVRATLETVNDRPHILLGVRNVDDTIRQETAHSETLALLQQKEKTHLEAILASAEGYLEANISKDLLLDISPGLFRSADIPLPLKNGPLSYDEFNLWVGQNLVTEEAEKFLEISSRRYLLDCFSRGERRASVSFSLRTSQNQSNPCLKMFFLYQDDASLDVMAFCVVYDLTEQQRKDKELRELARALEHSRIRNSTSQMQPHFLYNALGSIQEIVLEDPEYASSLIGDFTIHLRSCVRAMANDDPISFAQELVNIRAYVNIEKMRFGDKLQVCYDVPVTDFSILPLSIQPLVENAIRHGIYQKDPTGGTVTIRSWEELDSWRVEVEDNGVGFDTAAFWQEATAGKRDSTGLRNIIFRLEKVLGAQVRVNSTPGAGTKVVVSIPKGEVEP